MYLCIVSQNILFWPPFLRYAKVDGGKKVYAKPEGVVPLIGGFFIFVLHTRLHQGQRPENGKRERIDRRPPWLPAISNQNI